MRHPIHRSNSQRTCSSFERPQYCAESRPPGGARPFFCAGRHRDAQSLTQREFHDRLGSRAFRSALPTHPPTALRRDPARRSSSWQRRHTIPRHRPGHSADGAAQLLWHGSTEPFNTALADADALIRYTSVQSANPADPRRLVGLVAPLLSDPAAARCGLAPLQRQMLTPDQQAALDSAPAQYVQSMTYSRAPLLPPASAVTCKWVALP